MFVSPRSLAIATGVLLLHAAALWALQAGLGRAPQVLFVPVTLTAEAMVPAPPPPPPKRPAAPPQPTARMAPPAAPTPTPTPTPPTPSPEPVPVSALAPPAARAMEPTAPAAVSNPISNTPSAAPATPSQAAAAGRAPALSAGPTTATLGPAAVAPRVEMPSSDAVYLENPRPAYPALSRRLGEQGKVVVRVLIGADGTPQKAEIHQTSGFGRLDQAALSTAMKWRYVPGKRAGMPESMWFNVPINFVLE